MGASDIMGSSNSDLDSVRAERANRKNPPEFAPGQSDVFFSDDVFDSDVDTFGSGSTGTPDASGDAFGAQSGAGGSGQVGGQQAGFGAGTWSNAQGGFGLQGQQPQAQKSSEDRIFDVIAQGGKGIVGFMQNFIGSFKAVTPKFWSSYGSNLFIVSLVTSAVGLILRLFGLTFGTTLVVAGLVSSSVGVVVLMLNVEKGKQCTGKYKNEDVPSEPVLQDMPNASDDTSIDSDDWGSDSDSDDWGSNDGEADWGSDGDDSDSDFFSNLGSVTDNIVEEQVTPDEALSKLAEVPKGMYTRQCLYEAFVKMLPALKPDFATISTIDEDSDVFLQWEVNLRDAAEATGVKQDNLPELLELKENLFTIILKCTRPVGFKNDVVADEVAKIFAYSTGVYNSNVYAKSEVIGKYCLITVFTGKSEIISLKDMYSQCKDFMLDTSNYMPVVLGIDQLGNVIKYDFKKLESILITGMPRSGKSWFVQAVLMQLCALVSPRELNIYICDPKDGISDFKAFTLPHVKKFVSGDDNILNTLRRVVRDEAPRRKKIIGDAGNVNIWDYKERYPDVDMPVIYVLIDEVVTLAERMDKDTKREFQELLVELISQLPALGIRAFLIPHVVKNDIIAKTATDLIPCRVSVCGDAGHIEACTSTKPKDFPYKLTNKGDMAVRMPALSPDTLYVHGAALTSSNVQNNELFDYMRRVWGMLVPESVADSVALNADDASENDKALKSLNLDDCDDMDIFGTSDNNGLSGMSSSAVADTDDIFDF